MWSSPEPWNQTSGTRSNSHESTPHDIAWDDLHGVRGILPTRRVRATVKSGFVEISRDGWVAVTLLDRTSEMTKRRIVEHRPGTMPDIRADGDSVTFHLEIAGAHAGARLIIRCDADGTVWASTPDSIGDRKPIGPAE